MDTIFLPPFIKGIKKHSSIRRIVEKKVEVIVKHPLMGEPLKGNMRGYLSCPVKKSFLILYLYCATCMNKGDSNIVACPDCVDCLDETIKFVSFDTHDKIYCGRYK